MECPPTSNKYFYFCKLVDACFSYLQLIIFLTDILFSIKLNKTFVYCYSYAGRPVSASTATGSKAQHLKELSHLLEDAMRLS